MMVASGVHAQVHSRRHNNLIQQQGSLLIDFCVGDSSRHHHRGSEPLRAAASPSTALSSTCIAVNIAAPGLGK